MQGAHSFDSTTLSRRDVCVCLCVCDRPSLLPDLLAGLEAQTLAGELTLFVADNGRAPAHDILAAHAGRLRIVYRRVETPGVSAARNAAMQGAVAAGFDALAFLDDDEVPAPGWLEGLIARAGETGADIVCGPVEPVFAVTPPRWAAEGGLFAKTGETPCTANVLIRVAWLERSSPWFRPEFGRVGGGDREFLGRLIASGARFAVAPDALAREHIPAARLRLGYMFRIGLRDGMAGYFIEPRSSFAGLSLPTGAFAMAVRKLGYAVNHLAWSLADAARIARATRDFGTVAGVALACIGRRVAVYGPAEGGGERS